MVDTSTNGHMHFMVINWSNSFNVLRLLHGKCARTIFIHQLRSIRKRTSERSERVSCLILLNE